MAKKKRQHQRADFRKKYQGRVRQGDLTREYNTGDQEKLEDAVQAERLSGKGELTRKRTVVDSDGSPSSNDGTETLIPGRVLSVHGLKSRVLADDGQVYECAIRQVLKSLSIEQRNVVVAGDRVLFLSLIHI